MLFIMEVESMKIALLTCFRTLSCTYSLANVVAKHIEMLLDHDYEVTLFVCEGCNREQALPIYQDHRLHWGEIAASYEGESIPLADYYAPHQPLPDHFSHWLSTITESLCQALQHISLCMIHDIHFQKSNAIYHLALREALMKVPPLLSLPLLTLIPISDLLISLTLVFLISLHSLIPSMLIPLNLDFLAYQSSMISQKLFAGLSIIPAYLFTLLKLKKLLKLWIFSPLSSSLFILPD